jgi:hypothetical protein
MTDDDNFTAHQRKAGQSRSEKKQKAARENLEKARDAKRKQEADREDICVSLMTFGATIDDGTKENQG